MGDRMLSPGTSGNPTDGTDARVKVDETAVVTVATASLRPLADNPAVSVVALELDGWVRTPLGISYRVVVIADPSALATG